MAKAVDVIPRNTVVSAKSFRVERRYQPKKAIGSERLRALNGGPICARRTARDRSRNTGVFEKDWQILQARIHHLCSLDVSADLNRQADSVRTDITHFNAIVLEELVLDAQGPGNDLRLGLIHDQAAGSRARGSWRCRGHIDGQQSAPLQKTLSGLVGRI